METGEESDSLKVFPKEEGESVMMCDLAIEMEKDPRFRVITVKIRHLIGNTWFPTQEADCRFVFT